MVITHCALCKNEEDLEQLYPATFNPTKINKKTFSARKIPDGSHYRFVRCKRCGLIFSNPILETKKIDNLYRESEFTYTTEAQYLKKVYGYYLEKITKKLSDKKIKLLDIGCGNGFFLEEAKDLGVSEVYGIEPSPHAAKYARDDIKSNIKIAGFKKNMFLQNYFDVICCFHTLDHIPDPNEFLQEVKLYLKKGGYIIFIVHDTDGLSVKLFGEKSAIFDIGHIYLFNKSTLTKIFKNIGFGKIQVFDVKNTYPIEYWLHLMPIPKQIKIPFLSFLKSTKLGKIPFSINAGNICITAKV